MGLNAKIIAVGRYTGNETSYTDPVDVDIGEWAVFVIRESFFASMATDFWMTLKPELGPKDISDNIWKNGWRFILPEIDPMEFNQDWNRKAYIDCLKAQKDGYKLFWST